MTLVPLTSKDEDARITVVSFGIVTVSQGGSSHIFTYWIYLKAQVVNQAWVVPTSRGFFPKVKREKEEMSGYAMFTLHSGEMLSLKKGSNKDYIYWCWWCETETWNRIKDRLKVSIEGKLDISVCLRKGRQVMKWMERETGYEMNERGEWDLKLEVLANLIMGQIGAKLILWLDWYKF